jgi:hypothetical protein
VAFTAGISSKVWKGGGEATVHSSVVAGTLPSVTMEPQAQGSLGHSSPEVKVT